MTGPARIHPALRLLGLLVETPDDPDRCWLTKARTRPSIGIGRSGQVRTARLVLELKLGRPLRPRMCALHTCDNVLCVRPGHLFEGTHSDNARDMAAKRRGNTAKLSLAQHEEIGSLFEQGWGRADIAAAYGISTAHVYNIARAAAFRAARMLCANEGRHA